MLHLPSPLHTFAAATWGKRGDGQETQSLLGVPAAAKERQNRKASAFSVFRHNCSVFNPQQLGCVLSHPSSLSLMYLGFPLIWTRVCLLSRTDRDTRPPAGDGSLLRCTPNSKPRFRVRHIPVRRIKGACSLPQHIPWCCQWVYK